MKDKTTAGIFGIFLGGIGVHKFYLGRVGQGIVYLIFCWTFIPAVIGFIEGIIYLTMTDQAFNFAYNNAPSSTIPVVRRPVSANVADELEKLHQLKEKNVLTEEEFQVQKSKLIN